jgi:putative flavoprotein involved in K+ transport
VVVVGAGQAGLAMSYFLQQAGREHVVLERRGSLGGGWQDRWDAFRLVSPNWTASFPGRPYDGDDPSGFMPRGEIAARVAAYGDAIAAPVVTDAAVARLAARSDGGFRLETGQGSVDSRHVVIATGGFHVPKVPIVSEQLQGITQVHSHDYRNPASLPDGAVLVVGSGQSGVQIAEELAEAGREVYLSVGSADRLPRRYRGRDIFEWFKAVATEGPRFGLRFPSVDQMPDPRMRLQGNAALSGHHGGHETNLRRFAAARKMTLLGRIRGLDGRTLLLDADLPRNLAKADQWFDLRLRPLIDGFIAKAQVDAPPDDREPFTYEPPVLQEVNVAAAGITAVVWATGYSRDYGWIDLPITDEHGFPRQTAGASDVPGLFFLGSLWQTSIVSATLFGPMVDGPAVLGSMGIGPVAAA